MNFKGKEYSLATIWPWICNVVRHYKLRLCVTIFLGWVVVALNFCFVWATKQAVDAATVLHNSLTLTVCCVCLVAIIIAQACISALNKRLKTMLGFRMNRRMQERLFNHAVAANWKEINEYHTGDVVRRFEEDGAEIISFVNTTVPTMMLVAVQLMGAYAFLFALSRDIALALAVIMAVGVFVSKFHFLKIRGFSAKIKEGGSMLQAALQEGLQNISVLKALAGNNLFSKYYSRVFDIQEGNVMRRLRYSVLSSTVLNLGFAACYLFVFIWGVFNLESNAITYGTLIAFVQLVGQIQGPSRTLINSISDFAEFYASCERLNEIDAIRTEDEGLSDTIGSCGKCSVVCEGVSYRYTDRKRVVLDRFTHRFEAGKLCAIVGATGAGKTTLMRLLLSYVKPDAGKMYLETNGRRYETGVDTRRFFAYVPQGNSLFSMSLRDNMLLSNPNATDGQMLKALEWACADFVEHNAGGLDTLCGEGGRGLSQGQAQRLCIARALLAEAPVLLMDESTSALDRKTEETIIRNIRSNVKDKTILFITHRDTVVKYADEVVRVGDTVN